MPRYGHLGVMTLAGGAAVAALLILMMLTSPLAIGPLGVTAWFLVFFIAVSSFAIIAAFFIGKRFESHATDNQLLFAARRRGLMVGLFATVLLALKSLQQFNLRDALLLFLLLALTEFYLVTRS